MRVICVWCQNFVLDVSNLYLMWAICIWCEWFVFDVSNLYLMWVICIWCDSVGHRSFEISKAFQRFKFPFFSSRSFLMFVRLLGEKWPALASFFAQTSTRPRPPGNTKFAYLSAVNSYIVSVLLLRLGDVQTNSRTRNFVTEKSRNLVTTELVFASCWICRC